MFVTEMYSLHSTETMITIPLDDIKGELADLLIVYAVDIAVNNICCYSVFETVNVSSLLQEIVSLLLKYYFKTLYHLSVFFLNSYIII